MKSSLLLLITVIGHVTSRCHWDRPIYFFSHRFVLNCKVLIFNLSLNRLGGDLFTKISINGKLNESIAAFVIRQVVEGIRYLHSQSISHRDLKPENILCGPELDNFRIVITDFGMSKLFGRGSLLVSKCAYLLFFQISMIIFVCKKMWNIPICSSWGCTSSPIHWSMRHVVNRSNCLCLVFFTDLFPHFSHFLTMKLDWDVPVCWNKWHWIVFQHFIWKLYQRKLGYLWSFTLW